MNRQSLTTQRDHKIAQTRLQGATYQAIAEKHGISRQRVYQILSKEEIRDVLDAGINQMISLIPKAADTILDFLGNEDEPALRFKAAETVLKTGAIIPSNSTNQTITQIYNIQNNITLSDNVAKALSQSLTSQDPDVIDGEYTE